MCLLMLLMTWLVFWPTVSLATTYYASPTGSSSNNGLTEGAPFRIGDFWGVVSAGDTLVLLDGEYKGSNVHMILPPYGLKGTGATSRITVMAKNDGAVFINGEFARRPVELDNNDWFEIKGINVGRSSAEAISFQKSSNCIFRRIVAFDAMPPKPRNGSTVTNLHTFLAGEGFDYEDGVPVHGVNNLFEDMALFGYGRNNYVDGGFAWKNNTLRRVWMKWEAGVDGLDPADAQAGGPSLQADYDAGHTNIYENLIHVWSAEKWGSDLDAQVQNRKTMNMGWMTRSGAFMGESGNYFTSLLAYGYPNPPLGPFPGADTTAWTTQFWVPNFMQDLYTDVRTHSSPIPFNSGCTKAGCGGPSYCKNENQCGNYMSTKNRITLIVNANQNPSYIPNVPQHTNIRQCTSPGACPDIYTGEGGPGTGARLCYEYNNGTETTTPLWPWRMDQRIKDALALAGSNELAGGAHIGGLYAAKTVTSEIASRYGVPPPDCMRTGDGPPPGPTGPRTLFVDPTGTGTCAQAEQTATQTPIPMNNLVTMLTSCARGGDTVVLKFGTYAACLNDIIPSGSTSGDTVLRAETVGQAVIKPLASPTCPNTSAIYINNKQYISLSGLTIDLSNTPSGAINDGGVWLDGTTNHVTITGVEVKGMGVPGAFGGCAFCLYPQTSQNTVRNSLIHDLATSITNASVRATCFDNYGSQNTVENNICHHVAHTGYYGFTTGPASSNNIVRGNQFHNLGARGIYVSSGANNVVVNNLITQVGLGNGQEALIIGGGGGVAPTNTEILHNTITNNPGTGINVASGSGAILLNNILWQNTGGTIVNSGTGTVDDSNLKAIDPCFVNASLADFHLTTLSPAWNQGKATGSPNSVTVVADDITGLARQGTKPDIGCYELDETTVPTAAGQPTMRLLKRHIPGLMGLR